ncbi:MAG: hypothetical protein ACRDT0_05335, partial [Pseudonocardiaceae bacterium]
MPISSSAELFELGAQLLSRRRGQHGVLAPLGSFVAEVDVSARGTGIRLGGGVWRVHRARWRGPGCWVGGSSPGDGSLCRPV